LTILKSVKKSKKILVKAVEQFLQILKVLCPIDTERSGALKEGLTYIRTLVLLDFHGWPVSP
jgi:hypothetical protein